MKPSGKQVAYALLLAAILLVSLSLTFAQEPPPEPAPPTAPRAANQVVVTVRPLSLDNQQLADQYIEAIEQLETTIDDYVNYFEKFSPEKLDNYQISFEKFAQGLMTGLYSEDPAHLSDDLGSFVDHLRDSEKRLRASENSTDKKLYRYVRSLRRELAVILDLIEDAITQQDERQAFEDNIQVYIDQQLEEYKITIATIEQEAFANQYETALKEYVKSLDILSDKSRIEALKSLEQLEALKGLELDMDQDLLVALSPEQQKEVLKALESFEIDFTRDNEPVIVYTHLPADPIAPVGPVGGLTKTKPGRANVRSFNGTLGISSQQMPVYVTHPRGELLITGWNEPVVSAELYVVVEAPKAQDREAFLESVTIKMGQDKDGYFAETIFPRLTNPQLRVVESVLKVKVPSQNRVICNHSFGDVTIERFNHGVQVKGNNSSINVADINGRVKIENSLGPISIDRIDGRIQISNSSGQIFVTDCSARGRISSSAGLISVADSDGDFTLINSGPINVVDHHGAIDIENTNGSITLLNITGNISAYNTLQPIIVEKIDGEVTLENRNADIKAFQITKSLIASTSYADIEAGWIGEGFQISNIHGDIRLKMGQSLSIRSKITSVSGEINLIIPVDANLNLLASAIDGEIGSEFPFTVETNGDLTTAELNLGRGSPQLILKSSHGEIKIEEL